MPKKNREAITALEQGLKDIESFTPSAKVYENLLGQYPFEIRVRIERLENKQWLWSVTDVQGGSSVAWAKKTIKSFKDALAEVRAETTKWLKARRKEVSK